MFNFDNSPALTNCSFQANSANNDGGGMYNNSSSPRLTNCSFEANSASSNGGGMFNLQNSPTLTNCSFQANSASNNGGGMYNINSSYPRLTNCSFQTNSASRGGGMYNVNNSKPSLTNCSFQANTASNGGAIYNARSDNGTSSPTLTNCVLWNNGDSNTFSNVDNASVMASYNLFESGVTGFTDNGNNLITTTSPFASPTSTQLSACSPAINAGSNAAYTSANGPTTDLAGNPRFYNGTGASAGRIDMGAYEFQGTPFIGITAQPAAGSAVCVGGTVTASVSITGTVSGYQWYNANGVVANQTAATLSLPNAQPADAGSYSVVVTGACNSLTSNVFSLTVNDLPMASLVSSGTLTCAQTSITLTASGGVGQPGTAYTFSTGATQIGSTNQATVTTAGLYSVTVANANGCTSTTNTTVSEDKTPPTPPTLIVAGTTTNQITRSQNTGTVNLLASGCNGSLSWTGPDGSSGTTTTIAVSLTQVGIFVYRATCQGANGCIGAPASATVTVTSPNLTVLYRNENSKTSNDKIRPFFALSNGGSEALPLSQITVRYWLTVEDYNALDLKINNAKLLGSSDAKDQVSLRYVGLGSAPRQGAYGYLEYSFLAGVGTLNAGVTTGTVESEIKKQGGGLPNTNNFEEADDYSYMPNSKAKTLVANSHMTAYRNGVLVWGSEPALITASTAFKVLYQDQSADKRRLNQDSEGQPGGAQRGQCGGGLQPAHGALLADGG